MDLWINKYKPQGLADIVSQKKALEQAQAFVEQFTPGKALFLHGPSGIGKTLLVETIAKEKGLALMQVNASDQRTPQQLESIIQSSKTQTLFSSGKIILIDEIDGISGKSDRGGVAAIAQLIKQSKYPIFITANDPWLPKLRTLRNYCTLVKMNKVITPSIEKRIKDICRIENIAIDPATAKNLARWASGDLRSALMDLQLVAQGKSEIRAEDLEVLGFRERKNQVFSILPTIFRSGSISAARKAIMNADKPVDDIFLWIEHNAPDEFSGEDLPRIYDLLSKADLFRQKVIVQQNYRFKAYFSDLLASVSAIRKQDNRKFLMYRPSQYLLQMARSKGSRATMKEIAATLGEQLHCSQKAIQAHYIPFLKILLKKEQPEEFYGLDKEQITFIMKNA